MGTLAVDNIQHTDGSSAVTLNNANITTGTIPASGVTGTLGSGVFPAGMVIGSAQAIYEWAGDIGINSPSEAFGPVVSLQLKKANAKLYVTYNLEEVLWNGENVTFNVAYKASSFTAGTGNTSHGGAYLNQNRVWQARPLGATRLSGDVTINVYNTHNIGNSAGDTYYFSPEAHTLSAGATINNAGTVSLITFNIMEIS